MAACSTVPAALRSLRTMLARYYGDLPNVIVEPGVKTGVQLAIDNPKEVGADRVVNTLAAHALYGGPSIVVDFGTTTNFDVISAQGEFLGGAFAPGHRDLLRRARRPGRPAAQGRAGQAALGDRQEHRRVPAVRACTSASPGRSTGSSSG